MLKLIKLEWKKNGIGTHIRNAVILAAVLCLFTFAFAYLGIANDPDTGVPDVALGNNAISSPIELFTSMSFLVFTSVMLSSFIVSAYKNKTMNLMFSYPIKRQKILISQMLAVWIFNFAALVLTKLLLYGCVLLGSQFMVSAFPLDFNMASTGFYVQLIAKSVVYRYGYEIIKSNDYFFIPADYTNAGQCRRPNNGKQRCFPRHIDPYFTGFRFSLHTWG